MIKNSEFLNKLLGIGECIQCGELTNKQLLNGKFACQECLDSLALENTEIFSKICDIFESFNIKQHNWNKILESMIIVNKIVGVGDEEMCECCRQNPCDSRCPYAPEPEVFGVCSECNNDIYDGEDALVLDDIILCEDCVKSLIKTVEIEE